MPVLSKNGVDASASVAGLAQCVMILRQYPQLTTEGLAAAVQYAALALKGEQTVTNLPIGANCPSRTFPQKRGVGWSDSVAVTP